MVDLRVGGPWAKKNRRRLCASRKTAGGSAASGWCHGLRVMVMSAVCSPPGLTATAVSPLTPNAESALAAPTLYEPGSTSVNVYSPLAWVLVESLGFPSSPNSTTVAPSCGLPNSPIFTVPLIVPPVGGSISWIVIVLAVVNPTALVTATVRLSLPPFLSGATGTSAIHAAPLMAGGCAGTMAGGSGSLPSGPGTPKNAPTLTIGDS